VWTRITTGWLDAVRVIAKIDTALPGPYRFTFSIGQAHRARRSNPRPAESDYRNPGNRGCPFRRRPWQSESYRLVSIHFTAAQGARVPRPSMRCRAQALRTRIWAHSRFKQPGPRYEAGTVKVAGASTTTATDCIEGLEVEVVNHSVARGCVWEGLQPLCAPSCRVSSSVAARQSDEDPQSGSKATNTQRPPRAPPAPPYKVW